MKKIFYLAAVVAASMSLFAGEKVVWTGNEPISWNNDVYAGTQFETPDGIFAGLAKDNTIKVTVVAAIEEPQYVLTYKAGDKWDWTDLNVTVADGTMIYTVESEAIASNIAERGLIFRGQGYNITAIAVVTEDKEDPEDPEKPEQPTEAEYTDTVLWTGDVAISWNNEVYAGEQLDTYNVKNDMFAGVQEGDSIKLYYAEAIDGAQFALTYKKGEGWDWTDLTIVEKEGYFAYKVASDEIAMDIADHGLVIRGQGYHLTSIVLAQPKKGATGIEEVQSDEEQSTKVLRDGQVIIMYKGQMYDVRGQVINQ